MTELEKIFAYTRKKGISFDTHYVDCDIFKWVCFRFIFDSPNSPIYISYSTDIYEQALKSKELARDVITELSDKLAKIKMKEELDEDMEFLKLMENENE